MGKNPVIRVEAEPEPKEYIEEFIRFRKITKNITPNTEREYRRYLSSFIDELGGEEEIGKGRERKVALGWLEKPLEGGLHEVKTISNGTFNRKRAYLRAFFRWLKEEHEIIAEDPLKGIPKRKEEHRRITFGKDSVKAVEEELYRIYLETPKMTNLRNFLEFVFISAVGTRGTETGSFAREHIDPKTCMVFLLAGITKTKTSRHVSLPFVEPSLWMKRTRKGVKTRFQELLEAYYRAHEQEYPDPATPFFCSQAGTPLSSTALWQAIKPTMRKCGLDVPPHDLRHFALTQIAFHGGAPAVQAIAGHTSPVMTARYVNPSPEMVCGMGLEAIRKANDMRI